MLEALILWQLVSARNESRAQRGYNPEENFVVFMLAVSFLITIFIWPVNAVYRFGLMKKNRVPVGITVALVTMTFIGLGAPAFYVIVGFFWACGEMAAWMSRNDV